MPYQSGVVLLDKYRIETLLGQGAFGDVYRVTHLQLNVPRALKVLRRDTPGIGSTEFNHSLQRFQLEAQLGAKLNSPNPNPNLLQVHDMVKTENLLVLEMEYAPGGSLTERIQKASESGVPISIAAAMQIAIEVATGLGALHALDIVHRDLKPANILFDNQGHARVADLGLAQIPGGPSMRSQLSTPNPHPGTPGYMSPEQENTTNILKPPSDIYSLGLVLFEMLTGRNYTFLEPGTQASTLRNGIPTSLETLLASMLAELNKERPWNGQKTTDLLREILHNLQNDRAQPQAKLSIGQNSETGASEKVLQVQVQQDAERKARAEAVAKARREEQQARQNALFQAQGGTSRPRNERGQLLKPLNKSFLARYWAVVLMALVVLGMISLAAVFAGIWIAKSIDSPAQSVPSSTLDSVLSVTELPDIVITTVVNSPIPASTNIPTNALLPTATTTLTNTPQPLPTSFPMDFPILPSAIVPTVAQITSITGGSTQTRDRDGMLMVYVPAGLFTMGSNESDTNAQSAHSVTLDAYWIDQTEVTNGKYALCLQAGGCQPPADNLSYFNDAQFKDYPVIYINWFQAKTYCEWVGGRLPTEAEWEKAARGTDARTYPWGEGIDKTYANYSESSIGGTTPVGSYEKGKSPYGAYDMAGNVIEWTSDWFDSGTTTRVLRGGSWFNHEDFVRSAYRFGGNPTDATFDSRGFRCSRSQ